MTQSWMYIIQLFFELLERSNPEVQALANQMIKCAAYTIDAAVRELHFFGEKIPVYLSGETGGAYVHEKTCGRGGAAAERVRKKGQ